VTFARRLGRWTIRQDRKHFIQDDAELQTANLKGEVACRLMVDDRPVAALPAR